MEYKSYRIVDGKPRWVVVDENRKIVNRNPSKDELKGLEKEPRKLYDTRIKYTNKELLDSLIQYKNEYDRIPRADDFYNQSDYPGRNTIVARFGSWSNALKLVGFDVESMVKKGILENNDQKARFAEMIIKDHFKNHPIDLAGENARSPCDGICPNGKTYDVKSSKFHANTHWKFGIGNKHKDDIEIYYFLAFNEDYTELKYVLRVPGEIIEADTFYIGINNSYQFNIENMKEYDITYKLKVK